MASMSFAMAPHPHTYTRTASSHPSPHSRHTYCWRHQSAGRSGREVVWSTGIGCGGTNAESDETRVRQQGHTSERSSHVLRQRA